MSFEEEALKLHKEKQGKITIESKVPLKDSVDLSLAYTPGVAGPCRAIVKNPEEVDTYTARGNFVAVVSDGSAVLGLGNIGPYGALPVMEGKAILFKAFADVDAFPICINTQNPDEFVEAVKRLEPSFGGINLEDIAAPNCFYIERRLKEEMNIPIFHDDQHGTAVVVLAGIINGAKLVGRHLAELKVVINGAGAAGVAVSKLLLEAGIKDIVVCDRIGAIYQGRREHINESKEELARLTNPEKLKGNLAQIMRSRNVFIGVSVPNVVSREMVVSMESDPIIFAMSNPDPEILPDEAKAGGARIVGTGRSDFPNQVNNVLGFPGIFRGVFDVRATEINDQMKMAAAQALAKVISDELREDYILPNAFDLRVAPAVAGAVAEAAVATGVARLRKTAEEVAEHTRRRLGARDSH